VFKTSRRISVPRHDLEKGPKETGGLMARGGGRPGEALRPQDRVSNAQKSDRDHRRRGAAPYIPDDEIDSLGRGYVMTGTSDTTGVLVYTILRALLVTSWIYVPA
jgi:hypothetical protein